jgi:hypothetical protein
MQEIKAITYDGVNCYLLKNQQGFFLIDTGFAKNRAEIDANLQSTGCTYGQLKLKIGRASCRERVLRAV